MFETHVSQCENSNAISMCVQVAFIIAGSTQAVYYKTLKNALGIEAVSGPQDNVKSILDEVCEAAKQEMKGKNKYELG